MKKDASNNKKLVAEARFVAINNHLDVDDLVVMLEVTPEDLLERFEDRLHEHHDKFIPEGYTVTEEDYDNEQNEQEEEDNAEEPLGEES